MKRNKAVFYLLCAAALVLCVGCASVQKSDAMQKIDRIMSDGTLYGLPVEKAVKIADALSAARDEIAAADMRAATAEKKSAALALWATRGKWLTAGAVLVFLLVLAGIIRRFIP